MTTSTFPTSADTFVNPSSSDKMNGSGPDGVATLHTTQHAHANDAIAAIQTKVGIDSSSDHNSIDYKLTFALSSITTLSGDISTLDGDFTSLSGTVSALSSTVSTHTSEIAALGGPWHTSDIVATNSPAVNLLVSIDPSDPTKFKFIVAPSGGGGGPWGTADLIATNSPTANYLVSVDPSDTTKFKFIVAPSGGGGSSAARASPAGLAASSELSNAASIGSGSITQASQFYVTDSLVCNGVEAYWGDSSTVTLKLSLWDVSAGTRLASGTVSATGVGIYSVAFGSSVTLTPNKLYAVSAWETSGSHYSSVTAKAAGFSNTFISGAPFPAGNGLFYISMYHYASGDAFPNTTTGASGSNNCGVGVLLS